jgi:Flp pilus assembly protein TadD
VVATLCGAVALLMLGVVVHGRAEASRRLADAAVPPLPIHSESHVATAQVAAAEEPASAPAPVDAAVPVLAEPVAAPSVAEPVASPSVAPVAAAVPSVAPPPETNPKLESAGPAADAAKVLRKARTLLNSGRSRDGVAAAREALALSPQEAEPYMLLGAGLQDLGKYAEARAVFDDCVKTAKHGPVASCRYFSGH